MIINKRDVRATLESYVDRYFRRVDITIETGGHDASTYKALGDQLYDELTPIANELADRIMHDWDETIDELEQLQLPDSDYSLNQDDVRRMVTRIVQENRDIYEEFGHTAQRIILGRDEGFDVNYHFVGSGRYVVLARDARVRLIIEVGDNQDLCG